LAVLDGIRAQQDRKRIEVRLLIACTAIRNVRKSQKIKGDVRF